MESRTRFEEVFEQHFDGVLGFLLARAEPEIAKDVAAETFLVAWRQVHELPAEPKAWLLTVARRKLVDAYRSRGRRDALAARLGAEPADAGPSGGGGDPADEVAGRAAVLAAFGQLASGDQEVLRLVAWDGLSADEAAQVLGCSRALFAVRLHRARRRLRDHLATESAQDNHGARRRLAADRPTGDTESARDNDGARRRPAGGDREGGRRAASAPRRPSVVTPIPGGDVR